ncbi:hypothetical protein ACTA71_009175 [Dictyostelium dimigraforme]
MPKIFYILY